ncbi:HAD family hydrolase [Salibacterium lacus]|uniref:HAD family hydrolase n=1 Tax=Salibacterium lacus TaxID=1898109 RepID=A0ABW5T4N7_9BACI
MGQDVKAVIFDFDGLIMDTETRQFDVLQELFIEYGTDLPLEVWQQEIGTSTGFTPADYLASRTGKMVQQDMFLEQFKERFLDRVNGEPALPGAEARIREAQDRGLAVGLASSSDLDWVSMHLKNLGLFDYFSCIRTSDDVEDVKPDPALYEQTAACLGVRPEECVVFEDSVNGALAAERAGMRCVIVPNKVTETLAFGHHDRRLDSLEDTTLDALLPSL